VTKVLIARKLLVACSCLLTVENRYWCFLVAGNSLVLVEFLDSDVICAVMGCRM